MNTMTTRYTLRILIVFLILIGIYLFLQLPQIYHLFRAERSINILAWPKVLDREYIKKFEQETGYRVNISFFENYEELVVKLRASKGAGYDIVTTSDYSADQLIKDGLLKKIDKAKLPFNVIYPQLLNKYFDKNNEYTVPFTWDIYGVGIDRTLFKEVPEKSWSLLFKPPIPIKVGMLDDSREVVLITAQYLFGTIDNLTPEKLQQVKQLLLKQKEWVAMYTDLRGDYLLFSQTVPATMVLHSDVAELMRKVSTVDFLIPNEGSFIVIDNLALSAATKKDDIIYSFINYLFQPQVYKKYIKKFGSFSVIKNIPSTEGRFVITPKDSMFDKLHFFKNAVPEPSLNSIWIGLKS